MRVAQRQVRLGRSREAALCDRHTVVTLQVRPQQVSDYPAEASLRGIFGTGVTWMSGTRGGEAGGKGETGECAVSYYERLPRHLRLSAANQLLTTAQYLKPAMLGGRLACAGQTLAVLRVTMLNCPLNSALIR